MRHEKQDNIRKTMIGAPLLLTLAFCFGFFLIHPSGGNASRSTAITSENHKKNVVSSVPVKPLSPLAPVQTNQQEINQSSSGGPEAPSITSPQAGSGAKVVNPQSSATQHNGDASSGASTFSGGSPASQSKINPVSLIPSTLNNLIKL